MQMQQKRQRRYQEKWEHSNSGQLKRTTFIEKTTTQPFSGACACSCIALKEPTLSQTLCAVAVQR